MADLNELARLEAEATPGPWEPDGAYNPETGETTLAIYYSCLECEFHGLGLDDPSDFSIAGIAAILLAGQERVERESWRLAIQVMCPKCISGSGFLPVQYRRNKEHYHPRSELCAASPIHEMIRLAKKEREE